MLDPSLAGPLGLVTEVALLKVRFTYDCWGGNWDSGGDSIMASTRCFGSKPVLSPRQQRISFTCVGHSSSTSRSSQVGVIFFYFIQHNLTPRKDHIKSHARESQRYTYTLLLVPRTSTLVTRILEEEGVLGDVTISSYNLQFIPLAEDVVSLEYENAFKELWVVRHPFHLQQWMIFTVF